MPEVFFNLKKINEMMNWKKAFDEKMQKNINNSLVE